MVEQATHLVDLSRRLLGEATVVAATARPPRPPGRPGDERARHQHRDPPLRGRAGRRDHRDLHPRRDERQEVRLFCDGLAITIRQQGVLYEDARTKAVTATDGFTGSRLWGVTGTRYVPTGNDPFLRRGPGVPRCRPARRPVAAVQPLRRRAADPPPHDVDPRAGGARQAADVRVSRRRDRLRRRRGGITEPAIQLLLLRHVETQDRVEAVEHAAEVREVLRARAAMGRSSSRRSDRRTRWKISVWVRWSAAVTSSLRAARASSGNTSRSSPCSCGTRSSRRNGAQALQAAARLARRR